MIVYPENLPIPDVGDYYGVIDKGLIRTAYPAAAPSQLAGFNSPTVVISMTFSMKNSQWSQFSYFAENNGFDWFVMPVVAPNAPKLITSNMRVRFISDLDYQKQGDNWLSVTVQAEMVLGDEDDPNAMLDRSYDFIVAGTPVSPSVDVMIAGSPYNPSPTAITASIYKYEAS